MSRLIDLSVHIENNEHTDHPGGSPKVTYRTHKQTAGGLAHFFEGLQPDSSPMVKAGPSRRSRCRRTTAHTWMRPGTSTRLPIMGGRGRRRSMSPRLWHGPGIKIRDASAGWTRAVAILDD